LGRDLDTSSSQRSFVIVVGCMESVLFLPVCVGCVGMCPECPPNVWGSCESLQSRHPQIVLSIPRGSQFSRTIGGCLDSCSSFIIYFWVWIDQCMQWVCWLLDLVWMTCSVLLLSSLWRNSEYRLAIYLSTAEAKLWCIISDAVFTHKVKTLWNHSLVWTRPKQIW